MPPNQDVQEILRLTRENNRMLHKMRRNAFWGGIIKFALYALVLVVAPLWLYSTYLAPIMEQMTRTMEQIQSTGAQAKERLGTLENIENSLRQFDFFGVLGR